MMLKILAISGSLRSSSSNTTILRAMRELVPADLQFSICEGIGDLPHFNPELDRDLALAPVQAWRDRISKADAVIFCTPEYAHGIPGVLKNALDWIVSSGEFMYKPTAVISASPAPDGGAKATASLMQTLAVMMADLVPSICIPAVSAKLNDRGEITDPQTLQSLQSLLKSLVEIVNKS
ncbi:NADPH-dependent FMN reductase [Chamaesiphon sp. OTE_20_metabat_361]|uniref:NADPH-dependent FMN reductase n=1 Tax=Chamaesiphon sp. OTE_20_metabat_361 TaxID=2964689 RepID=UPI00286CF1B6|nr:NADPH-dependent FMN reductase [Chamaesiphon sp. OTE_20_metabat_361]